MMKLKVTNLRLSQRFQRNRTIPKELKQPIESWVFEETYQLKEAATNEKQVKKVVNKVTKSA